MDLFRTCECVFVAVGTYLPCYYPKKIPIVFFWSGVGMFKPPMLRQMPVKSRFLWLGATFIIGRRELVARLVTRVLRKAAMNRASVKRQTEHTQEGWQKCCHERIEQKEGNSTSITAHPDTSRRNHTHTTKSIKPHRQGPPGSILRTQGRFETSRTMRVAESDTH